METVKIRTGLWHVTRDGAVLAELHLDKDWQMEKLVLRTVDPSERRKIRELATSHMWQFCRNRSAAPNIIIVFTRQDFRLTEADSDALMRFDGVLERFVVAADEVLDKVLGLFVKVEDDRRAA